LRSPLQRYLALGDFEAAAQRRLPQSIAGLIAGASETNATRDRNIAAFAEWDFLPRVLRNTTTRTQTKEIMGFTYRHPFGIAPMGAVGLAGFEADLALAGGAHECATAMILSGFSLIPLEEVAKAGEGRWFQAYIPGDRDRIGPLLARVEKAGFQVLVITVDTPVSGNKESNMRNGFSLPLRPTAQLAWQGITHPRWVIETAARTLLRRGVPHIENVDAYRGPPIISSTAERNAGARDALSWEDIRWIRERWRHKLILKGILTAADASLAADAGVDGVIVSNHGGRQLDGAVATIDALPAVAGAARKRGLAVMFDGGVRRGASVLKALALGADFVFVGRPFACAAAVAGVAGVKRAIQILGEEVDRNMALLGQTSLAGLSPALVRSRHQTACMNAELVGSATAQAQDASPSPVRQTPATRDPRHASERDDAR